MRVIRSAAPIRICDNGGWTDTWFARHGRVFQIAVEPCVHVELRATAGATTDARVTIHAESYGDRYLRVPELRTWDRHPLIEAAIAHVGVPAAMSCEVRIYSDAPAGASTGTSASVTVALIGALARLAGRDMSPDEAARAAHHVETHELGQQSGVQDQLAAAHGGINFIEIDDYPTARLTSLEVAAPVRAQLEQRLLLLYLGRAHHSSIVHDAVIRGLTDGEGDSTLADLRRAAVDARDAVMAGDLEALGGAMQRNTEAQSRLQPDLVTPESRRIIAIARAYGAPGWKVNGAGGVGGSMAILCAERCDAQTMVDDIAAAVPASRRIPVRLSPAGLRVREVVEHTA